VKLLNGSTFGCVAGFERKTWLDSLPYLTGGGSGYKGKGRLIEMLMVRRGGTALNLLRRVQQVGIEEGSTIKTNEREGGAK